MRSTSGIQAPDVAELLAEPDTCLPDLEFPDPVVSSRPLADRYLRLHRMLEDPGSRLEVDTALVEFFCALTAHSPASAHRKEINVTARKDPALRTACELLRDRLYENVTLDELAAAAGAGKFRLARLFRTGVGVGPHGFQIVARLQRALSMLDAGLPAVLVATTLGFHDQSHFHRHFTRVYGMSGARRCSPLLSLKLCPASGVARTGGGATWSTTRTAPGCPIADRECQELSYCSPNL